MPVMARLFTRPHSAGRTSRTTGALVMLLCGATALAQAPAAPRAGQLPILPMTQLDEHALSADLDNKAFTLTFAQPVAVRDLLLLLVRGTALSIAPDPAISGSFIGELKNVTVRQALDLILPPLGLDYSSDGPFIRVFRREAETRLFDINYIAAGRTGTAVTGGAPDSATSSRVTTTADADVFAELAKGVQTLVSEHGAFNVDRKAGLLQVTDFPERLDRVQAYLDVVSDHVHRQVEIDARILEVELNETGAPPVDFASLVRGAAAPGTPANSRQMVSGLSPGDVQRFMTALATVGKISVLADPHILALNNEPALVRAVTKGGTIADEEGVTLTVIPQIAGEGAIMLSLSPVVSQQIAEGSKNVPATTAVRATDTLARVADGGTIVLGGFTRERETRERQASGGKSGWFGRSTVTTRKTIELVILLTPRIVGNGEAQ